LRIAFQTNTIRLYLHQQIRAFTNKLVCLKRDFGPFSDLRFRQTVPNNIVLLVMARPRCHALPVLPAACGCGATLSRHFTDHVTFSRHFQRFFKE
jgi:hypothetical protein